MKIEKQPVENVFPIKMKKLWLFHCHVSLQEGIYTLNIPLHKVQDHPGLSKPRLLPLDTKSVVALKVGFLNRNRVLR